MMVIESLTYDFSSPALNQLRQHMMGDDASLSHLNDLQNSVDDSIDGLESSGPRIDL